MTQSTSPMDYRLVADCRPAAMEGDWNPVTGGDGQRFIHGDSCGQRRLKDVSCDDRYWRVKTLKHAENSRHAEFGALPLETSPRRERG